MKSNVPFVCGPHSLMHAAALATWYYAQQGLQVYALPNIVLHPASWWSDRRMTCQRRFWATASHVASRCKDHACDHSYIASRLVSRSEDNALLQGSGASSAAQHLPQRDLGQCRAKRWEAYTHARTDWAMHNFVLQQWPWHKRTVINATLY